MNKAFTFADVFAGLGGFHTGLGHLGHKCVFACEIDEDLRVLYEKNFHIKPHGDIRKLKVENIPAHDILCAGFPCQPFSKAGDQEGLDCPTSGNLIGYLIKIIRQHKPSYFILENVPNLLRHENGNTWNRIIRRLQQQGEYHVEARLLSPHKFGVPQIRQRVFIVGQRKGLRTFSWPTPSNKKEPSVETILDKQPRKAKKLSEQVTNCLDVWQEFLEKFPKNEPLPTFPIWSMEFGATYPFVKSTPYTEEKLKLAWRIRKNRKALRSISLKRGFKSLPSYARTKQSRFPEWKIDFIKQNRALYRKHKKWLDPWLTKIRKFPHSLQKLEWNCNSGKRNIWEYIIQIRASGVRVKKRTSSPSLVAMTTTQVPIVAWEKRYMTARECARLQSLTGLRYLPKQSAKVFKALGNAVNAYLVELIAKNLLFGRSKTRKSPTIDRKSDKRIGRKVHSSRPLKNTKRAA